MKLVLLRHGESHWNKKNRFTGWTDVDLSKNGIQEAKQAGQQLKEEGYLFDIAYTSFLKRAIRTLWIVQDGMDYHVSADLTGQANHLGVTIEADIIKQKLPECNGGFNAVDFGKTDPLVYDKLTTEHPIDLTRYQVVNCYMGRIGLINSGGASGKNDIKDVVKTAVINKRAGGMGLISGRKAFQKPMKEGVEILNALQDVYLEKKITIA